MDALSYLRVSASGRVHTGAHSHLPGQVKKEGAGPFQINLSGLRNAFLFFIHD